MKKYLLGIDIGTSSSKITLFDFSGKVMQSISKKYPTYYPKEFFVEQDPNDWYLAISDSIKKITSNIESKEIAGIGIAGQSWSAIPVDKSGNVLTNNPIWLDSRAQGICEDLKERLSEKELFSISGNPLSPNYSTPKILWFKKHLPKVYQQTHQFLQSNSYIIYRLTNRFSQDLSQGYAYHFFDLKREIYDEKMATNMGVDLKKLPPLFACHDVVGTVTKEASIDTGLNPGTPVVAGGLDAACAALGVGVLEKGQTQEQGGQAGGMSICCDQYFSNPKLICSLHVIPHKWLLQGGTVGGSSALKWFSEQFKETSNINRNVFETLTKPCYKLPAGNDGVIFLPYLQGERSPIWDPKAKGVFYGINFSTTKAHFTRAILEGVAYALRHNIETSYESGAKISELIAMGGAANNPLWMQIKADVTKLPVKVTSSSYATTLGAALLAGVGVGVYPSFEEAVDRCVKTKKVYMPDEYNCQIYNKNYLIYRLIYQNLKNIMERS